MHMRFKLEHYHYSQPSLNANHHDHNHNLCRTHHQIVIRYGSSERFLDGAGLPPGRVTVLVSSPFEPPQQPLLDIRTSFVNTQPIDLGVGRHALELHFQGSRR